MPLPRRVWAAELLAPVESAPMPWSPKLGDASHRSHRVLRLSNHQSNFNPPRFRLYRLSFKRYVSMHNGNGRLHTFMNSPTKTACFGGMDPARRSLKSIAKYITPVLAPFSIAVTALKGAQTGVVHGAIDSFPSAFHDCLAGHMEF